LRRGELDKAEAYYLQSLPLRRAASDRQGEGATLFALGQLAEAREQYALAASRYQEGIALLRAVGDRINVATGLETLGALLIQRLDDPNGGCAAYTEAVGLWRAVRLPDREKAAREAARALGCEG
jgi:tetratricopeptide (TPR) repeat protein